MTSIDFRSSSTRAMRWHIPIWFWILLAPTASGILAALCFPPFKLTHLVWFALIPLSLTFRSRGNGLILYFGTLLGSGIYFGIGTQFLDQLSPAYRESDDNMFRLWLLAVGLSLWVWPLAAFITRILFFHCQIPYCAAFGCGWVLSESLRDLLTYTLFGSQCPWMHLGYAATEFPPVLMLASLGGISLISWAFATVNASLSELVLALLFRPARAGQSLALVVIVLLSILLLEQLGARQVARANHIPVAMLSDPDTWQDTFRLRQRVEQLCRTDQMTQLKLLIGPEQALQELVISGKETNAPYAVDEASQGVLHSLAKLSQQEKCHIVVGTNLKSQRSAGVMRWNSILHCPPVGTVQISDKQLLVPFAEHVPNWSKLPWIQHVLSNPQNKSADYAASSQLKILDLEVDNSTVRIVPLICYDCTSPLPRLAPASDFQLVVQIGFEPVSPKHVLAQWMLDVCTVRAVESGRTVIRCTSRGYSGIIEPTGRTVVLESDPSQPEPYLYGNAAIFAGMTFYSRAGDWPIAVLLIFVALALVRLARHQSRARTVVSDVRKL